MKLISYLFVVFGVLLCSCNNNDDQPPTETELPIAEVYLPATTEFSRDDAEFVEKIKPWFDKTLVINSESEMDEDPFGFSDAYRSIDFNEYTLLVAYQIRNYPIDTYRNRYYRDNVEQRYNWAVCIKTAEIPDNDSETLYFTRYAILVKKLPENADLAIWFSIGAINWGWGDGPDRQ